MRSNRGAHSIDMSVKWKHVALLLWVTAVNVAYYRQFWTSLDSIIRALRHVLGVGG